MEEEQNYTSFVVTHESGNYTTKNVVVGYKLPDGTWKRLSAYDVTGTVKSKETIIDFSVVKKITLFCDYPGTDYINSALIICDYEVKENINNIFFVPNLYDGSNIVKKNDNTKYPIE